MAIKVEELQTIITANADQFKGELIGIREELMKLNGQTKKTEEGMFGNFFKANVAAGLVTGTIRKVIGSVKGLTTAVVENGSAYSRVKIATDTVLQNMGITAEKARELRDALKDANTYGTVAEQVLKSLAMSGLVDMADGLKAVDARTGEVREGVSALVLTMKDLSAAALLDSSVGIERITKFVQRGEASFADGIIEIGELNREYAVYAQQVGKSTDMLTAQERAQVRLNIVMREGQKVFGAYANTYQTSGKAFGSIRDVTRNITEIIGNQFEPVLRVAGNAILMFFNGVRDSLFQKDGEIRDFATRIAGYLAGLVRIVGMLLSKIPGIGKNFRALAEFTVKPIKTQGALANAANNTGQAFNNAAKGVEAMKKQLLGLAGFDEMDQLQKPESDSSQGTGAGLGDIGIGGLNTDEIGMDLEDVSADINKFADETVERFANMWNKIKGIFDVGNFNLKLLPLWSKLIPLDIIEGLLEKFKGHFDVLDIIIEIVQTGFEFIEEAIKLGGEQAIDTVRFFWEVIKGIFTGNIGSIKQAMSQFGTDTKNNFKNFFENMKKIASDAWANIRASASSGMESFKSAIGKGMDWVWGKVSGVFNNIKNTVKTLFSGVNTSGSLANAFKQIINALVDKLNSVLKFSFSVLGKNITIDLPDVPKLAQGGYATGATLAMFGEAGDEAVLPLDNNTEWAEKVASLISQNGGGNGSMQLVVKLGEEKIYDRFIDYANEKTLATNMIQLNI